MPRTTWWKPVPFNRWLSYLTLLAASSLSYALISWPSSLWQMKSILLLSPSLAVALFWRDMRTLEISLSIDCRWGESASKDLRFSKSMLSAWRGTKATLLDLWARFAKTVLFFSVFWIRVLWLANVTLLCSGGSWDRNGGSSSTMFYLSLTLILGTGSSTGRSDTVFSVA